MSKLERVPALGRDISIEAYESSSLNLSRQAFFGVGKLILGKGAASTSSKVEALFGVPLPEEPNTFVRASNFDIAWTAPNQWLLLGEEPAVEAACDAVKKLLSGNTGLVLSFTDALAVFKISKANAGNVLASLVPLDLHPRAFTTGRCANSHLGEIGVFIQQCDDVPTFRLMVDQSYATYAWRLLAEAGQSLSSN